MQYNTVFDVTNKSFQWWPMFILLVAGVGLYALGRRPNLRGTKRALEIKIVAAGALFFSMLLFVLTWGEYSDLRRRFDLGDFQMIEGRVENFHPMRLTGGEYESFTVRGVPFSYSDYESSPGFNQTSSHGGPIHGGLEVRITYARSYDKAGAAANVILKLEVSGGAQAQ